MNTSFTSVSKWFVAIGTCVIVGLLSYDQVKHGPPVTQNDQWDLLMVILKASGAGALGRGVNVGIQKAKEKKETS